MPILAVIIENGDGTYWAKVLLDSREEAFKVRPSNLDSRSLGSVKKALESGFPGVQLVTAEVLDQTIQERRGSTV